MKKRRAELKHRVRSMLGEWERPFKPQDLDRIRQQVRVSPESTSEWKHSQVGLDKSGSELNESSTRGKSLLWTELAPGFFPAPGF